MSKRKSQGKALVIFSGGQDSTTCLYYALEFFDEVEAITFFYGQNHAVETIQAELICRMEKVKQKFVDISFLTDLVDSALTSGNNVNEKNVKGLPASFVPNRNALFITLAHAYAQKIGANTLVTGVCQTDFAGYPDCRRIFINQIDSALNYGSQSDILIDAPLMNLNKAQTFEVADELGVLHKVIENSHTCYKGVRDELYPWGYGCDDCGACSERKKGYKKFITKY